MGLLDDYGPLLGGLKRMPPGTNPLGAMGDASAAHSPKHMPPLPDMGGAGSPGFPLGKLGAGAIPLPDPPKTLTQRMPVGLPSIPMESPENGPVSGRPSTVADARNPNAYSPNPMVPKTLEAAGELGIIKPPPRPAGIGTANALRSPQTASAGMDFGLGDKGFGGPQQVAGADLLRKGGTPKPGMNFGLGDQGFGGDPATALGMIKPPVRPPGLGTGLLAEAPLPPVRPPGLGASPIASAPITPPPITPPASIAPPIAPAAAPAPASIGGGGAAGAAGGGLGGLFSGLAGIAQGIGGGGGAPAPPQAKAPTLQPMQPDPRAAQRAQGAQQIISGLLSSGGAGLLDDPRKRRGMA